MSKLTIEIDPNCFNQAELWAMIMDARLSNLERAMSIMSAPNQPLGERIVVLEDKVKKKLEAVEKKLEANKKRKLSVTRAPRILQSQRKYLKTKEANR